MQMAPLRIRVRIRILLVGVGGGVGVVVGIVVALPLASSCCQPEKALSVSRLRALIRLGCQPSEGVGIGARADVAAGVGAAFATYIRQDMPLPFPFLFPSLSPPTAALIAGHKFAKVSFLVQVGYAATSGRNK